MLRKVGVRNMSEVPKSHKELILYALAKAVDARCSITYFGDVDTFYKVFSRYYSSIIALINAASPYLSNVDELLRKAKSAWDIFGGVDKTNVGGAAKVLDEVFREVINEVKEVIK